MSDHNRNKNAELLQRIEDRRLEWNSSNLNYRRRNYKTVLLGACGVGKTSLLNRHVRGIFNPGSESTIGASFCTSSLSTSIGEVMLYIWDTAGQERYSSLIPMYYRDAGIALVVFDMTDIESFERAKHWIDTIEESKSNPDAHIRNTIIVLIGNKMDKELHLISRLDKDASTYAESKNIPFVKASARSGEGVVNIFATAIIQKLQNEARGDYEENSILNTIQIDSTNKGGLLGLTSCIGVPSVLTIDYWRRGDKALKADEQNNPPETSDNSSNKKSEEN